MPDSTCLASWHEAEHEDILKDVCRMQVAALCKGGAASGERGCGGGEEARGNEAEEDPMMLFDAWLASWIKEAEAKKEAPAAAANKRKREEMEAEKKARLRRQRLLARQSHLEQRLMEAAPAVPLPFLVFNVGDFFPGM